ncbi:hypothetical protein BPOR_1611g00020 [Botrytis porri]|uniref:Uncharacterized protein n=1 Tax=Botrytis porri TaxID=87229 RepID=A0A4Z1K9R0_9HELO|nr:hypothetical protein BPOR_1611g00020 [Botrytis porri]
MDQDVNSLISNILKIAPPSYVVYQPIKVSKPLKGQRQRTGNIDHFFARYPNFVYESSAPIWMEFNRLCSHFNWDDDDYNMREAKRKFKSAMVQEFNVIYGTDEKNLGLWQKLCYVLNIEPVPESLNECRKHVLRTHVNLVDLVETPRTGNPVEIFADLKDLREYTIKNEKFFPKEDAYAGGLLKFLLREIS